MPYLLIVNHDWRIVSWCGEGDLEETIKDLGRDEGYDTSILMPYQNDPDVWALIGEGRMDEASKLLQELEGY